MSIPAFYVRDTDSYVPTGLGISPWNNRAQMGVALAGLVAQILDSVGDPVPMLTTRLTIDLLGAVPVEPLRSAVRVLRDGRQMRIVEAELGIGERVWVRATALRVRIGNSPGVAAPLVRPLPDAAGVTRRLPWVETVRVEGDFHIPGPGAQWVRLTSEVIAGDKLSPLSAIAMVADFGTGTAPLVSPREWTFANIDIALHLTRPPRGEWLLIDATSASAGNGFGITLGRLGDTEGMIGTAHQTAFLSRRASAGS